MADLLKTYLQDHHAGSTMGRELARRTAGANEDNDYGPELARIAAEIDEDRDVLEQVMERLGVGPSKIKDAGAWTAEKLGRLKPNDRLLEYSPLSRLIEIEGLVLGVTGKQALWEAIQTALGESLDGISFEELVARAVDQRSRLQALHLRAAADAFAQD